MLRYIIRPFRYVNGEVIFGTGVTACFTAITLIHSILSKRYKRITCFEYIAYGNLVHRFF